MKMIRFFFAMLIISEMTFSVSLANNTNKKIGEPSDTTQIKDDAVGQGKRSYDGKYKEDSVVYLHFMNPLTINNTQTKENAAGQGKNSYDEKYKRNEPRSCLDHLKRGETGAKVFTIMTPKGPQEVFCDLRSEAGSAWTLVLSHRMEYRFKDNIAPFQKPLHMNLPVNEKSPNYYMYRMTLAQMTNIKSHSTHWRVTCNGAWVDYRDYLRIRFADLNPLTFIGAGVCKKVEYINVRGHVGIEVTAAFWQIANKEILHHDSSASHCSFGASKGYSPSEDNFGFYKSINKKFRCSSYSSSTSSMWFGVYL